MIVKKLQKTQKSLKKKVIVKKKGEKNTTFSKIVKKKGEKQKL